MLNKSIKMTEPQYRAAKLALSVLNDLLDQAHPDDETPFEITLGEGLEVMGRQLMGNLQQKKG